MLNMFWLMTSAFIGFVLGAVVGVTVYSTLVFYKDDVKEKSTYKRRDK